jgi:hypothetical protein
MATLYNIKSGEQEDIPDSQAAAALRSGTHGVSEGKLPFQDPDTGEIVSVPTEDTAKMYEMGFRTPTQEAVGASEDTAQKNLRDSHFDGTGTALAAGALRGATLGASDAVIKGVGNLTGNDLGAALNTTKEVNPIASTVGEVGGAIAGSVATGGFGTQAGIAKLVGGAGEAIEAGIGLGNAVKGFQVADSTAGLLKAGEVVTGILQGAAEGAVQGVGIGLSDSILKNTDDVAEKMMINAFEGAKLGGFIGGAVGGMGAYGAPLAEKAMAQGRELADIAVANTTKMVGKIGSKFIKDPEAAAAFRTVMEDPEFVKAAAAMPIKQLEAQTLAASKEIDTHFAQIKTISKSVQEDIKDFANSEKQTFVDALAQAKDDIPLAYESLRAQKNALYDTAKEAAGSLADQPAQHSGPIIDSMLESVKRLENSGLPAEQALAKDMYSNIKYTLGEGNGNLLALKGQQLKKAISETFDGAEDMAMVKQLDEYSGKLAYTARGSDLVGKNKKMLIDHQNEIRSVYDSMDNQVVGQAFKDAHEMNGIYQKVGKTLFSNGELKTTLTNPRNFESLNGILDQIGDAAPQIKELSELASKAKQADALQATYKRLNQNARVDPDVMEKFIQEIGGDVSKTKNARALNDLQAEFKANPEMTAPDKLIRLKTRLGIPIEDDLKALAANQDRVGIVRKVLDGSSSAGGSDIGSYITYSILGPKGLALYKGAKVLSNNPYAALRGASNVLKAYESGASAVERAGTNIVNALADPKAATVFISSSRTANSPEDIKKAKDTITLMNDPKTFQEVMGQKTQDIATQPAISSSLNMQTIKTMQFLQSKLPVVPDTPIGGKAVEPSVYESAKFSRYLSAVESPLEAVHKIAAGRGTPEEIEALKAVYPSTFSDLQKSIMNGIVDRGLELPYSKRVALSQMFDLNLDSTLSSDFIQKMQANLAQSGSQNGGAGRPQGASDKAPRFKRNLDEMVSSDVQKLTNGEYKS